MIRIAVCDDDPAVRAELRGQVGRFRPEYRVDAFASGGELLSCGRDYDIVFLDIEMPPPDGMETARRLAARAGDTYIVFLTSHTEYMREAFKVRAYRYLVKPVPAPELRESIVQAEEEILGRNKILSKVEDRTTLIDLTSVVCIEAYGDGSLIHTRDGTDLSNRSLKFWAERLGTDRFFRVHRSYLVALGHVRSIDRTGVTMEHMDASVPVSRRCQSAFRQAFAGYVRRYAKYV